MPNRLIPVPTGLADAWAVSKQAIRELALEAEKARLDALGVIHAIRGRNDLEEAPSAYKDIDQVMENQCDLFEIVVKLRPLAVVKG